MMCSPFSSLVPSLSSPLISLPCCLSSALDDPLRVMAVSAVPQEPWSPFSYLLVPGSFIHSPHFILPSSFPCLLTFSLPSRPFPFVSPSVCSVCESFPPPLPSSSHSLPSSVPSIPILYFVSWPLHSVLSPPSPRPSTPDQPRSLGLIFPRLRPTPSPPPPLLLLPPLLPSCTWPGALALSPLLPSLPFIPPTGVSLLSPFPLSAIFLPFLVSGPYHGYLSHTHISAVCDLALCFCTSFFSLPHLLSLCKASSIPFLCSIPSQSFFLPSHPSSSPFPTHLSCPTLYKPSFSCSLARLFFF